MADENSPSTQPQMRVADGAPRIETEAVAPRSTLTNGGAVIPHESELGNGSKVLGACAGGSNNIIIQAGGKNTEINIHRPASPNPPCASAIDNDEITSLSNGQAKASYPHTEYNNRVIWSVVKNLTDHQLHHIKILLRKESDTGFGIPNKKLGDISNNDNLIDVLENSKLLSINNTWFLQHLVSCAKNKTVYKEILGFMVERMTKERPVCIYEPEEPKDGVQFKVAGDIEKFLNIEVEAFRQILAENCGGKVHYTSLMGIENGCVKLSFSIPSSCKEKLQDHVKNQAEWLTSNGIFQVYIDGQQFNLPKSQLKGQTPAQVRAKLLFSIFASNPNDAMIEMPISKTLANSAVGGKPFLHWACELNKPKWVDFLLANGADVNATDEFGCTALHKVAFLGLLEICKTLVLTEGIHHFAEDEIFQKDRKEKDDKQKRAMEAEARVEYLEEILKQKEKDGESSMKQMSKCKKVKMSNQEKDATEAKTEVSHLTGVLDEIKGVVMDCQDGRQACHTVGRLRHIFQAETLHPRRRCRTDQQMQRAETEQVSKMPCKKKMKLRRRTLDDMFTFQ